MLSSIKQLRRLKIAAVDGDIGSIKDVYFDDERWTVRYLVVDTGEWLASRVVLVSPAAVRNLDWDAERASVDLTQEQVRNSPDLNTDKPVSRQQEAAHADYFGYSYYWMVPVTGAARAIPPTLPEAAERIRQRRMQELETADRHLRSTAEMTGYRIDAVDGKIGHVDDFLFDDNTWMLRFLVIDTRIWIPGKHVLVAPDCVERVSWAERTVAVALNQETIRTSPEYKDLLA